MVEVAPHVHSKMQQIRHRPGREEEDCNQRLAAQIEQSLPLETSMS